MKTFTVNVEIELEAEDDLQARELAIDELDLCAFEAFTLKEVTETA